MQVGADLAPYLSRTPSTILLSSPSSRYSHGRLVERRNSSQNRKHHRLSCLPRFKHLHRCRSSRYLLPWQRDLHHSRTLGFSHLVPHPCSPPWYHHLPILPPGQARYHRWYFLEVPPFSRPQRHLRQPLGLAALHHRYVSLTCPTLHLSDLSFSIRLCPLRQFCSYCTYQSLFF